jgi:hypothetical protein
MVKPLPSAQCNGTQPRNGQHLALGHPLPRPSHVVRVASRRQAQQLREESALVNGSSAEIGAWPGMTCLKRSAGIYDNCCLNASCNCTSRVLMLLDCWTCCDVQTSRTSWRSSTSDPASRLGMTAQLLFRDSFCYLMIHEMVMGLLWSRESPFAATNNSGGGFGAHRMHMPCPT